MRHYFQKILRVSKQYGLTAAGTVAIVGFLVYERNRRNPVYASWTTNFEPSVKWDNNWDRRDPESLIQPLKESATDEEKQRQKDALAGKVPTVTRHLILIRHGQYYDKEKEDHKRILTALGREQANITGQRLADLNYPYSKLISSTMPRARETADIIHKHLPDLPREQSDLLREGAPIPPEPPVGHWKPEKHFYQDGPRIEAAFRKYFHRADVDQTKDSYEIVVCHANVIRYFVCRALQFPPEGWLRLSLNHASLTWIHIRPNGRVGIRMMGEAGHMPVDKISVL